MKKKLILLCGLLVLAAIIIFANSKNQKPPGETAYAPVINPVEFSSTINNPYFTLIPGKTWTYEGETVDGREHIEVTVTNEKKIVVGVETVMVRDQAFLNGELIEDTKDWYAQDSKGNVWYFGEQTAEYEDGKVTTTAGTWEAGVDGALPGIIVWAQPEIGKVYRQEYYKGEAEDMADIVALSESIIVPTGTYEGCLKTHDYTPLDPTSQEQKYYCPDIGGIALEVDLTTNERTKLISIK